MKTHFSHIRFALHIWLTFLSLIPFLMIVWIAFLRKGPYGELIYSFTFENFRRCFSSNYGLVLYKSIGMSFNGTLLTFCFALPVSYYLSSLKGLKRHTGLLLLFIPFWTSFILRIFGLISVFGNNGLLNNVLMAFKVIDSPVPILFSKTGLYFGLVYNYLPMMVIPIYSSLTQFDDSLREAAFDLGATPLQFIFKVLIPCVWQGIVLGLLFVFIPMLGEYLIPDLLGGAKEIYLGNLLVRLFFINSDWPMGSAFTSLLFLAMLGTLTIKYFLTKRKKLQ